MAVLLLTVMTASAQRQLHFSGNVYDASTSKKLDKVRVELWSPDSTLVHADGLD